MIYVQSVNPFTDYIMDRYDRREPLVVRRKIFWLYDSNRGIEGVNPFPGTKCIQSLKNHSEQKSFCILWQQQKMTIAYTVLGPDWNKECESIITV